jgi:CRP/FNR family transcriptional regulator, cyclic AMP receptor protein
MPAPRPADLAPLDLFADLPPAAVERLIAGLPLRDMAPGDAFDVAETDAACCLVTAGRLALEFATLVDRTRMVGLLEEGDLLVRPVQTWASVGPRLSVRAIEASTLVLVDQGRLEVWMREPALAVNIVRILSAQVADRELALAIALEPRIERRLLLKLRQLALRWGRVTPEGVRLDLRLTHQELANMVGAVRESVTLALGRLSEQGEVTVRNRTLVIRRPLDGTGA